jgi:hypothetical protein
MLKKLLIASVAAAASMTPAFAAEQGTPKEAPRGSATGYAVPTANGGVPGAQVGTNWTSRSGNTNIGGYASGNSAGGYEGGARIQLRF